jgi:hypothetical protein
MGLPWMALVAQTQPFQPLLEYPQRSRNSIKEEKNNDKETAEMPVDKDELPCVMSSRWPRLKIRIRIW